MPAPNDIIAQRIASDPVAAAIIEAARIQAEAIREAAWVRAAADVFIASGGAKSLVTYDVARRSHGVNESELAAHGAVADAYIARERAKGGDGGKR